MIKEDVLEDPSCRDTAIRIAAEATRLFAIKGYDGVSIKEISKAAGVSTASVHYHFGSKAHLFTEIIEQFISEPLVSARSSLLTPRDPGDLRTRLEIFMSETVEAIVKRPDVLSIIQREMDRSKGVLEETVFKHLEVLTEFLIQAKKNKILSADIDPPFAARFLVDQITLARETRWLSEQKTRNRWIRQLLRLFLGGVMKGNPLTFS